MRRAVKLRKEFFVQAATEILFDIASVLHNGAKQHEQNQTCLRELARLQAGVIAVRLGIRVSGDPAAVGFPHLLEIVKPMGSHAQCVADQGPDNRAGGTFPNRCSRAQCLTMTLARKVMMYPISQAGIPAAAQSSSAVFRFRPACGSLRKSTASRDG